jgi:hypothetical protein
MRIPRSLRRRDVRRRTGVLLAVILIVGFAISQFIQRGRKK